MATDFSERVILIVLNIPKGKVASYGQIAALAGKPHAARGVSWILHSSSTAHKLPWHRVLAARGRISFPKGSRHHIEQKRLLAREGIKFDSDGSLELSKFQWSKQPPRERRSSKPPAKKLETKLEAGN